MACKLSWAYNNTGSVKYNNLLSVLSQAVKVFVQQRVEFKRLHAYGIGAEQL